MTTATTCTTCRKQVLVNPDGSCPSCGSKPATSISPSIAAPFTVRPAARPRVAPAVDLAFVIDRTGSSLDFQRGIQETVRVVLDQVAGRAREVRTFVGTYGDHDYGEDEVLLLEGGSATEALDEVGKIVFGGGGDAEEHHLDGIRWIASIVPWTADPRISRGALVALTNAGTKPDTSGKSPREIGRTLSDRGVLFYLVGQLDPRMTELVEAAQGLFLEISNDPDKDELRRIADIIGASISASVSASTTRPVPVKS
jgi:hypothetical protein